MVRGQACSSPLLRPVDNWNMTALSLSLSLSARRQHADLRAVLCARTSSRSTVPQSGSRSPPGVGPWDRRAHAKLRHADPLIKKKLAQREVLRAWRQQETRLNVSSEDTKGRLQKRLSHQNFLHCVSLAFISSRNQRLLLFLFAVAARSVLMFSVLERRKKA